MCNFRIGQKVVCINAGEILSSGDHYGDWPEEDKIYTVRNVLPTLFILNGVQIFSLYLNEIRRGVYEGKELGYWHIRFRPACTRPTDISAFKEILRKVNMRTPVGAPV